MVQQKQCLLILLRTLLSPQQSYTKDADTSGAVHSKDVAKPHQTLLYAPLDCFTLAQRAAGALSFE